MTIDDGFRRWVIFSLSTQDGSKHPGFDAIIDGMKRDDIYDEMWHITGRGVYLPTLKDIMNDLVRAYIRRSPLIKFEAKYNVRTRSGSIEI